MCDHSRRPKLFCTIENCRQNECCACSICMKQLHNHDIESYLNEKDVAEMLTRFELPSDLKQARKNITLKAYKFLTRFKTQLSNRIQDLVNDIMSKVKYPYLYSTRLLESYRCLRDKQYQRLTNKGFNHFCKAAKTLTQIQFISKEQQYYTQYLKESRQIINTFPHKIAVIEQSLGFTLSPELITMCQEYVNDIDSSPKGERSRSPQKKNSSKSISKLKGILESPAKVEKGKLQFLTPTRPTHKDNVSSDNLSSQTLSVGKDSTKNPREEENLSNMVLSIDLKDVREIHFKRSFTNQEVTNLNLFDLKSVKSQGESVTHRDSPNKQKSSSKSNLNSSLYSYKEEKSSSYMIKITDPKFQLPEKSTIPSDLTKSIPIEPSRSMQPRQSKERKQEARKKSFNEEMNEYMKERQQNIRKRLDQLKKQNHIAIQEPKKVQKQGIKKESPIKGTSKKIIDQHSKVQVLKPPPRLDNKTVQTIDFSSKRQKKSSTKIIEMSIPQKTPSEVKNYSILQPKRHLSPPKRNNLHNVSLNKHIIQNTPEKSEKGDDHIHLNLGNLTKEIPLVSVPSESPRKHLLQRKNSLQTTTEEELEASCILITQIERIKDQQILINFLQKFIDKYENCITGVEHLTCLYLQEGKIKECLMLSSTYLQKMDFLRVADVHKVNLIINKSAALNLLGREQQTVSFLTKVIDDIEHQKLHKNLGDAFFNLSSKERAIYHYEKATKLNPSYDQAYYNLSVMLYLQTSYFNALMNIDKALKFQPKNESYLQLQVAIRERITNSPAEQ